MIFKLIRYFGQPVLAACDANCRKAWGINSRPTVHLSGNEDNFEWLADGELGDAPADPGTYEGDAAKPIRLDDRLNRWCVRECERCQKVDAGLYELGEIKPKDFAERARNIPAGTPSK